LNYPLYHQKLILKFIVINNLDKSTKNGTLITDGYKALFTGQIL
jgi:hypothetical protein